MRRKIKYVIFIAIIFTFIFSGAVFAYYVTKDSGEILNSSLDISEETVIQVSSFSELIEAGTASDYNDNNSVSSTSNRKIIRFTESIELKENIILTQDIHIDLNSKTLYLNGKELTFKHGYYGCFMLYNGNIDLCSSDSSKEVSDGLIVIDLPNSGFEKGELNYYRKGVKITDNTEINRIFKYDEINHNYLVYSALYLVANAFSSDLDSKPAFMSFDDIIAITSFTPGLFVTSKKCSYNSNTNEACSFVYRDLDLIYSYLSTDIVISYTSSDTDIIDNMGILSKTKYGNVNFTVTISKTGEDDVTCVFPLHVVDLSSDATKQSVGLQLLKGYLSDYHVDESLVIKEQVVLSDYYYNFSHAINLPSTALNGLITYTYSTTNLSGTTNANSNITLTDIMYIFEPSLSDYHLVVNVNGSSTALNMYSTYVGLEEIVAYYIANSLYGGSIIYNKASTGEDLITYDTITAENTSYADLKTYLSTYGVTGIAYTLTDTVATHYNITDNKLVVKTGVTPADKEKYVKMTIKFASSSYDIDLYVEYLDSNGSTLSSYITYYSIYNAAVPSELQTSFTLPFCSNYIAPYTCYDVAIYTTSIDEENNKTTINETLYKPVNLKIELWYDKAPKLEFAAYDAADPSSFTNQLNSYLTTNNITLQDLADKTGDNKAYYKFSIDAQNSLEQNTKIIIIYNYKFNPSAEWTTYGRENGSETPLTDNNTTYLTVLGGLFYSTTGKNASNVEVDNAVKDSNFFIWIYNKFRPQTEGYEDIAEATTDRIIPIDWLGQSATITKDDTGLSLVENFSGIKYLTGITEADLSESEITDNILTAISEMASIKSLNLSNCGLTSVSQLSKLSKQGTLRILDISKNAISYFEDITSITSLEKVYLYNNNQTNDYYGSKGICNFQAFADLMRNGCSIYNDISNEVPVLYAESDNLDDYRRLKEIAYQSSLKAGLDVRNLYSQYTSFTTISSVTGNSIPGTNPFGLQTQGTLSWGYEGDTNEGNKYTVVTIDKLYELIAGSYTKIASFVEGKTYYVKDSTADSGYKEAILYELSNGSYSQTTAFVEGKTYVKVDYSNATYFYVKLTYSTGEILKVKYYVDRY